MGPERWKKKLGQSRSELKHCKCTSIALATAAADHDAEEKPWALGFFHYLIPSSQFIPDSQSRFSIILFYFDFFHHHHHFLFSATSGIFSFILFKCQCWSASRSFKIYTLPFFHFGILDFKRSFLEKWR